MHFTLALDKYFWAFTNCIAVLIGQMFTYLYIFDRLSELLIEIRVMYVKLELLELVLNCPNVLIGSIDSIHIQNFIHA